LSFLIGSGILFIFFFAISSKGNLWTQLGLMIVPFLVFLALLITLGLFQIRLYQKYLKQEKIHIIEMWQNSFSDMKKVFLSTMPLIVLFVALWMMLGIAWGMAKFPGIGAFFGVFFSFIPFVIVLASFFLILLLGASLFFVTPYFVDQKKKKMQIFNALLQNFMHKPFSHFLLFVAGFLPLFFTTFFVFLAVYVVGQLYFVGPSILYQSIYSLFLMIPISICFTPVLNFLYFFAYESYKILSKGKENE
ncbi:MAG TPA: hypothetical protein P5048_05270, partial [Chlamydiales bacterium]|nr:hypothetical protein [Chlamydiales bacterium]